MYALDSCGPQCSTPTVTSTFFPRLKHTYASVEHCFLHSCTRGTLGPWRRLQAVDSVGHTWSTLPGEGGTWSTFAGVGHCGPHYLVLICPILGWAVCSARLKPSVILLTVHLLLLHSVLWPLFINWKITAEGVINPSFPNVGQAKSIAVLWRDVFLQGTACFIPFLASHFLHLKKENTFDFIFG